MEKIKIIILDIDGVLNSNDYYTSKAYANIVRNKNEYNDIHDIDPKAVAELNYIIEKTNAEIIVSSQWRIGRSLEWMQKLFADIDVHGSVVGMTALIRDSVRGNEIQHTLALLNFPGTYRWQEGPDESSELKMTSKKDLDHKHKRYVIIDDNSDMLLCQSNNFVQTNWEQGLTRKNADTAIAILNKSK